MNESQRIKLSDMDELERSKREIISMLDQMDLKSVGRVAGYTERVFLEMKLNALKLAPLTEVHR